MTALGNHHVVPVAMAADLSHECHVTFTDLGVRCNIPGIGVVKQSHFLGEDGLEESHALVLPVQQVGEL